MEKIQYNYLTRAALILTVVFIGWSIYDSALQEKTLGESSYHAANKYFEDGEYEDALQSYNQAVNDNPSLIHAHRGIARTLMQLGRYAEASKKFDEVIDKEPEFGASYANRGILNDRIGNYEGAISDYEKAIKFNPKLSEGPSWITRFLRNQAEKPSTIIDRLNYLKTEMEKPEHQRLLKLPDKDKQQRPYKL